VASRRDQAFAGMIMLCKVFKAKGDIGEVRVIPFHFSANHDRVAKGGMNLPRAQRASDSREQRVKVLNNGQLGGVETK